MADVTVEFGAKDAGLSQTLKNVQKELADLDTQQKKTAMSADEFQRSLSRTKGLQGMEQKLKAMSSEADKSSLSLGKIGLAAGVAGVAVKAGMMAMETATAAARAVVDGFVQAIDLGGKLNDLSSRTGETAGNLLVLQRAFENSGVGADAVGQSINKLQKFMAEAAAGGAQQTETLNALGISMSDLAGKTPTEQMQVLAQKIAAISDPAERARASMEIFGKSGGQLLPLLNDFSGELDTARGQLGSMPGAMDRSAKAMDDLGDGMGAISSKAMEFAAGFIEKALPALNAFTSALSGVDATGWGQALMKQVMAVTDFLVSAFKAPMPAIQAIGIALLAGVKQAGNNYLNSLIDAGNFLRAFFSSELPKLIAGQIGIALIKTVIDFSKFFVDNINSVVKGFEEFFGKAIENVITFFSNSFNKVVNAFAADFKNAMSDPIGFVTGKFNSALAFVSENGAMAFKTAFDAAGGSVLDKISSGLGATSDMYGERLKKNTAGLTNEFNKVIGSFEKSDIDIFGAKESSAAAVEKFKEVEAIGTKIRTDFEKSAKSAGEIKNNTSGAANDADSIKDSFSKAESSARSMKQELSTSANLLKSIAEAEAKKSTGISGLEERAQKQIKGGQFQAAKKTAEQIQNKEVEASIRGEGKGRDRRSMADIGKDFGLSQQLGETSGEFAKRVKDVKEGKATPDKFGKSKPLAEKPSVDKPGKDGKMEEDKGTKKSTLETTVEAMKKLLEKIEPKLPQQALAI
jgi:hypothetical protein